MVVDLCKRELDEMFEEGVNYFNLFAEFVFDIYSEVDSKADKLFEQSEEEHFRYFELRRFIKKDMFDDFLVVYITRIGTSGLIEVGLSHTDHQEKARRPETQRLLRTHAHPDPRERPHHQHHWYTSMTAENSRADFYVSKDELLVDKRRAKSNSTDCSFCDQPIHSKVLLMRCRHPVCFVCLKDVVRDPKDYMCPTCSEYQNMYWKFYTCLADPCPISIKENAEVGPA